MRVTIYRKTLNEDWMGRAPDGTEVLFSRADKRLRIGAELDVDGLHRGAHVNFPVRYAPAGQGRKIIARGVIEKDYVTHGSRRLGEYWSAITDKDGYMDLNKRTGPSAASLGTLVEIYRIARDGIVHAFVNDWDAAAVQYPTSALTDGQRARVGAFRDLVHEPFVGTVAVVRGQILTVVLDTLRQREYRTYRTVNLYVPETGYHPVGTRLVCGVPKGAGTMTAERL